MSRFTRILLIVLSFLVHAQIAATEPSAGSLAKVAVFYPEAREPYKTIYRDIVNGIKGATQDSVVEYQLEKQYNFSRFELHNLYSVFHTLLRDSK